MTAPAMFTHDPETGLYYPANKAATAQCSIQSKMRLGLKDLLAIKSRGIRVTDTRGEDICLSMTT